MKPQIPAIIVVITLATSGRILGAEALPPLRIDAAVEIEMTTELGKTYDLQASVDLADWRSVQTLAGVGQPTSILLSIREQAVGYFRLVETPGPPGFTVPGINLEMTHLPAGWWAGKYEVTQAQFESLMGFNPSKFKGAQRPVEGIWWDDAVVFCWKLTEQERAAGRIPLGFTNFVYRLPTATEWRYACAGGSTNTYFWGDSIDPVRQYGWIDKTATMNVGSRMPNAFGLYDTVGNVWDWTSTRKEMTTSYLSFGGDWRSTTTLFLYYTLDWIGYGIRQDTQGLCGFRVVLAPPE